PPLRGSVMTPRFSSRGRARPPSRVLARRDPKTPLAEGWTFPPEWQPHTATWLSWPRPEGISFPDRYLTILPALAAIVREIAKRERVEINVPNGNWEAIVRRDLAAHGTPLDNVHFHLIKTN